MTSHTYGIIYGIAAFTLWGLLPLYWKLLDTIPPLVITAHRLVWSTITLIIILAIRRRIPTLLEKLKQPRTLLFSFLTGSLLFANWLIYIWAVNNDMIVSVSFGYFILPLMYIVIGYFMLNEAMSRLQIIAVGIAAIGVLMQGIGIGGIPWPALLVASTFAIYGVCKKMTQADGFSILTIEVGTLSPIAIAYLYLQQDQHSNIWMDSSPLSILIIILSGLATITPLLFFTAAAKRIPLNQIGILQFIAPTGQFLLGILYYKEVINLTQVLAFSLIWIAIIIYSISRTKLAKPSI
ncbi:MAG: EamA family transporter RarD [Akkermansiaceae bacterium]